MEFEVFYYMNSAVDVWGKVLDILRKDLTETAISTWFDDCGAVELKGNRLILHTPTKYKKGMIEERFLGTIRSAINDLFSSDDFEVVILDDEGLSAMEETPDVPDYLSKDEFTFEHFVVGNTNKFAHAAALAVAEGKGKKEFNPLFIHGESGVGKTHLLLAIRHAVETKFPHYNIVYAKTEEFLNELIVAIQKGESVKFREKYRGADFFLIDDIQFIAGKTATQEEFFHTFDTLYELGKQIVFTSDRPPKEMYTLEDRIRGRFESGLIADIQAPDEVLRRAIIKSKAKQLGTVIPDDVIDYIADNLDSSVRQLECAVGMIIAYKELIDEEITLETIKARLKDILRGERELMPTPDDIIEETARFFGMVTPEDIEDIKSKRKDAKLVLPRQVAIYLIRRIINLTQNEISKIFNYRDHSTVNYTITKIEKKMSDDKAFANNIKDITSNINSKKPSSAMSS